MDGGRKDIWVTIIGRENSESVYSKMVVYAESLDLPIPPGDYSIVFSNRHARVKNKKVTAEVMLVNKY